MGAIAVAVDWAKPVEPGATGAMMKGVMHRCAVGRRIASFKHAELSEGRVSTNDPDWAIASTGALTLVGDIRLWHQDRLKTVAGGAHATDGLDDRQLILAAYRRRGWQTTLDAIDGDFAFVIWDDESRIALAARDRFGVVPLFMHTAPSGVRFGTEPKQLAGVSAGPDIDEYSVAAHLAGKATAPRRTFFTDVKRVLPGEVLIASDTAVSNARYWQPIPADVGIDTGDVPDVYRELLVDAVSRRIQTSPVTISQLSGGLDSTTIAASAAILTDRGLDPHRFATVSAVFPDQPADESHWIDQITASQPFSHNNFEPQIPDIDVYVEDMWHADRPWANPIRDLEAASAAYGNEVGAGLMLSGRAGDDVVDDDAFLPDMLRHGSPIRWWQGVQASSQWSGFPAPSIAAATAGQALPQPVKNAIGRTMSRGRQTPRDTLASRDLLEIEQPNDQARTSDAAAFPTRTQRNIIDNLHAPHLTQTNEFEEAQLARFGMTTSQPHLDRDLVEFVASIPLGSRPYDGRTKNFVRSAFRGHLPADVIDRTTKTIADDYIVAVLAHQAPQFRERFPIPAQKASQYIDGDGYDRALQHLGEHGASIPLYRQLWPVWTLMLWLDTMTNSS